MEVNMKASGRMTYSMAQENGFTLMDRSSQHFSVTGESMERQYSLKKMALLTIVFITMTWKTCFKGLLQDAGTALG